MFLTGKIEEKPKMVLTFEDEDDDFVRRLIPPFDGLLPISHELSNNIYRAEIEIQELDDLRKPMGEDEVLKEVSETLRNVIHNFSLRRNHSLKRCKYLFQFLSMFYNESLILQKGFQINCCYCSPIRVHEGFSF